MPRFPRSEPEIAALALVVTQGLTQASDEFPTPPVAVDELQARLDAYNAALSAAIGAETAAREQHAAKDDALEELVDGVKANLKYAEIAVRDQPEKLSQLGWGVPVRGSALEAPGEVRDIAIRAEGETWVVLDWKAPVDGGTIAARTTPQGDGVVGLVLRWVEPAGVDGICDEVAQKIVQPFRIKRAAVW